MDPFTLIALGLILGLIVLLALQIVMSVRVQRLTYPLYEYAQSKAHAEADRILNEAREQAHKIVADAQANAAGLVEKERTDIEMHARDYQKALETLSQSVQRSLAEGVEKANAERAALTEALSRAVAGQSEEFKSTMTHLGTEMNSLLQGTSVQAQDVRRQLEAQSKQAAADLSRAFDDIAAEGRKRIDEQINMFSKQADAEVAAYRDSRKRIVDAHMTDLVIEATKLVLQKALTQEEHAQLVERALKEAHTTGIL